jgi:hypothetical protein
MQLQVLLTSAVNTLAPQMTRREKGLFPPSEQDSDEKIKNRPVRGLLWDNRHPGGYYKRKWVPQETLNPTSTQTGAD